MTKLVNEIKSEMHLQLAVPREMWQGSRLIRGGGYPLLGATVAPEFEFIDFEIGQKDKSLQTHPRFRDLIAALTRD